MWGEWSRLAILLTVVRAIMTNPNGHETRVGIDESERSDSRSGKPHIIMILADDLGWNDVSFHGSDQIPTPNIDALAYNGVVLNSHYVAALCTPSRAALLTGKYPIRLGMQHSVLLEPEPRGLPLRETLMPQHLKQAGYKTHAIGKWHLGYHRKEYTPTYRGFDSHFGYWNGLQDYYTHEVEATLAADYRGFDMRRNMSVAWDTVGKYSTDLFTEEAVRLIEAHDNREPMFMYLAHLAPHTGNRDAPFQAPDEEIAKFTHIDDPERRIYAAMVSKLDQSIGEVIAALRRRDMLANCIVLFMSDNGAPTMGIHSNRGSNYPMRGIKDSPWEGGVRGVAALWSPLIEETNRVSNQLMYVTDWLPTFYDAAGMDPNDLGDIDGIDMWPALRKNKASPRSEIVVNIDDVENYAAIRKGEFKYVIGMTSTGDGWSGETGRSSSESRQEPGYDPDSVLRSKAGIALAGTITAAQVERLRRIREGKFVHGNGVPPPNKILTSNEVKRLRNEAELTCNVDEVAKVPCDALSSPCLFNIREDPCEMVNLARSRPLVLATLEEALMKHRLTAIPASNVEADPDAKPERWNGTWVNWKEADPMRYSRSSNDDDDDDLASPGTSTRIISGPAIAAIAVCLGLITVATIGLFATMKRRRRRAVRSGTIPERETFRELYRDENVGTRVERADRSQEFA